MDKGRVRDGAVDQLDGRLDGAVSPSESQHNALILPDQPDFHPSIAYTSLTSPLFRVGKDALACGKPIG